MDTNPAPKRSNGDTSDSGRQSGFMDQIHNAVPSKGTTIVVIEPRTFFRDCIARALKSTLAFNVLVIGSLRELAEFVAKRSDRDNFVAVLCMVGIAEGESRRAEMVQFIATASQFPTIVISDSEEGDDIVEALELGVKAYIPTNTQLEVMIEAIRMVKAGGTFVPAASLIATHKRIDTGSKNGGLAPQLGSFSSRQANVIEALRRGKSNKVIAYELNMCESTVKVHVRNIMKRLNAKNRTEVAFMANEMLQRRAAQAS